MKKYTLRTGSRKSNYVPRSTAKRGKSGPPRVEIPEELATLDEAAMLVTLRGRVAELLAEAEQKIVPWQGMLDVLTEADTGGGAAIIRQSVAIWADRRDRARRALALIDAA